MGSGRHIKGGVFFVGTHAGSITTGQSLPSHGTVTSALQLHRKVPSYPGNAAYRYGIQMGRYAFGTAIEFMMSIIGLAMVLSLNAIFKRTMQISII